MYIYVLDCKRLDLPSDINSCTFGTHNAIRKVKNTRPRRRMLFLELSNFSLSRVSKSRTVGQDPYPAITD